MRKPRVLIVDDDPITRAMVSKKLKSLAQVLEAENGKLALETLERKTVDLAIVDLAMPVLSGSELIALMREHRRFKHIPIIVLTANQTREGLEDALRAGATSFLLKPLNWKIFGDHIRRVIELARHISQRDHLTGLPNRSLLNQSVQRLLTERANDEAVAVCVVDLDNFKHINDTLGHAVGDRLLMLVAERLRSVVRSTDTVARISGDVFAIVQSGHTPGDGTEVFARRIMDCTHAPYDVDGRAIHVAFTMGVAVGTDDSVDSAQLIRNADLALHETKRDGRGSYRLYETLMDARLIARNALAQDLRRALEHKEFELHYQPLVSLQNGEISGFEALIRWRHPERGLLPPSAFIAFAEEKGLIVPISEWAISEACSQACHWPDDQKVAVNISAMHIRDGSLKSTVATALAASGLAPHRLELEITETSLLQNTDANLATLHELRDMGVRIAMDDFGTGYSSLSYLQRFPFDKIKIDRSFVADIDTSRNSLNIVRSATGLANGLDMASLAEGVETEAQLHAIIATGCREGQGYYFSKPLPAERIPALLTEWSARPWPPVGKAANGNPRSAPHSHSMVPGGLLVTS